MPNPYTLLSSLPLDQKKYSVLDLKDAFFSLPLAPKSQKYFVFEWHDPEKGINGQFGWTHLPQSYKNSSTIFDEALHEDLGDYRVNRADITLVQYVDDLLILAETEEGCKEGTQNLLQALGNMGYRASAKKAQLCKTEVNCLSYILKEGQWWLSTARKETVLKFPTPQSPGQVRESLGSSGFCRPWIPGFVEIAKPLYEASEEVKDFVWTQDHQRTFERIK